ncbi:acyl-CoA dehydrogenase [Shewanella sp. OPT22]|nr:acyl-CoA dehydrogenase [Shewanella sp. OPT22]
MEYTSKSVIDLAKQLSVQFAARASDADKQGRLPIEDVNALKSSGYLTLNIPKKFGGSGLPIKDCIRAQLEIAQGSPATALVAAMPLHIFGQAQEHPLWSEQNYVRFCKEAVAGAIFNFAGTEPELGSPSRGQMYATTAIRTSDGLLINGRKICTTGGKHITHLLVTLDYEGEPKVVLVENHLKGISWQETWGEGLSLRASDSHDVIFSDVFVPVENLLISESNKAELSGKAWFIMMVSSVYLGAAIGARNAVIQYALERTPTVLGKPIATLPGIQRQIGEIDISLQAARAMLLEAAESWEKRQFTKVVAAKYFALKVACEVTQTALEIAGHTGLTCRLPLEIYFRDVRAGLMQPPKGDTALELIGQGAIEAMKQDRG